MGKAFTSKTAGWSMKGTGKRTNVMERGTRPLRMEIVIEDSF